MSSAVDIDALLAAPKALGGAPTWVRDDTSAVVRLAAPVALSGVVGSLILHAHATLQTTPQRGSCVLVYEGQVVQRLSILPDHAHFNPFNTSTPTVLRGFILPAGASRSYPWPLNRAWPRATGDNVSVAEPLLVETVAEGLTIFLALCGIEGDLPPPPWEPRLL